MDQTLYNIIYIYTLWKYAKTDVLSPSLNIAALSLLRKPN